jgi:hypothetical protein
MSHEYNLRTRRPRHRSSYWPPLVRPSRTMATEKDALDAVAAVGNRIDLMEAGQTNMTTQLETSRNNW